MSEMSGLLGKVAGQLSGQKSSQSSNGSSGLMHKMTDTLTGQKHPQDSQNYQAARPYSEGRFVFRILQHTRSYKMTRTDQNHLPHQDTSRASLSRPKVRDTMSLATRRDTGIMATRVVALGVTAMGGDSTPANPPTAMVATEDMGSLLPMKESILPIRLVTVDVVHQGVMTSASIGGSIPRVDTTPQLAMRVMESTEADITVQLITLQAMASVAFRTTTTDMVATEGATASTMTLIMAATKITKGTVCVTTMEYN